jgi:hypothetical protein
MAQADRIAVEGAQGSHSNRCEPFGIMLSALRGLNNLCD